MVKRSNHQECQDGVLEEVPLISIGYDMHELAEEFCGGGVGQGGEGDGAAHSYWMLSAMLRVGSGRGRGWRKRRK